MTNTEELYVNAETEAKTRRDIIMDAIETTAMNLMHYDRKEDEDLGRGQIEAAINAGEITIDEMVEEFRLHIAEAIDNG